MKTMLHTYSIDTKTAEGKAEWTALKARLSNGPRCHGPVLARYDVTAGTVDLATKNLFDNQWNTVDGKRVFDWTLEAEHPTMGSPRGVKRGHYLEQTVEMREIRRNTYRCGYCGKQEPAAKGYVFCPHCLDSEYLKESDLRLTRMLPVEDTSNRAPLSEAEKAHLIPLFREAQIHGSTERGKARIASERGKLAREYEKTVSNAKAKRDGMLWLMDHGVNVSNVIFYDHTGRFSFGWRKPLSEGEVSILLEAIGSEFPFPYDIKCDNGRTMSGE